MQLLINLQVRAYTYSFLGWSYVQPVRGYQTPWTQGTAASWGAFSAHEWKGETGAGGYIVDTGMNAHIALGWYSSGDKSQKQFNC